MSDDTMLSLPTRQIPVPKSVSPAAQAMLARYGASPATEAPAPSDHAGWTARVAATDAMLRQMLEPAVDALGLQWEAVTMGDAKGYVIDPPAASADDAVLFDLHGGGLTSGGGDMTRLFAATTAAHFGLRVYAMDYRMPPLDPYPAALDDCLAGYKYLLERYPAERIMVRGASAGGNLAAALVLRARDEGVALPAGLILMTPELDLTESGDTFQTNALVDVVLKGSLMNANLLYADGQDLSHPYLSPLFGDVGKGFPPTIITTGTRDLFLSNGVRFHNKLRRAGNDSELIVEEAMPHGGFFGAPEDDLVMQDLRAFVARVLGR